MSAPEPVVQAMRDEMDAHHPTPCMPHWDRCCCACGRRDMTGRDAMAHHEQATADAAFAASVEWLIEDIASTERAPLLSTQLRRRWARGDAS